MARASRLWGWTLIGMGMILAGVTLLGLVGFFPVDIELFGISVGSTSAKLVFVAVCLGAAGLGVFLVRGGRGGPVDGLGG